MKSTKWRVELLLVKKLIKYDIKAGFTSNKIKFYMLMGVVFCIGCIAVHDMGDAEKMMGVKPTVLDYVCFFVGGPKHIPYNMYELYVIPVLWLLLQVMIGYMVGYYAMTDLSTYGQQVLIRSGSRLKWWFGKCVWNGLTVLMIYAVIYLGTIISGTIGGADVELRLTKEIVTSVCNVDALSGKNFDYIIILFLMPVMVSLAISMIQMFIALISSPIIGFIFSQSIVFMSTLFEKKYYLLIMEC